MIVQIAGTQAERAIFRLKSKRSFLLIYEQRFYSFQATNIQ